MAGIVTFELHRLGWHSFQQLCHTIATEVWGHTVEAFLDGNDGGRDGAFTGAWNDPSGELAGRFVIQCKHTSKQARNLRLSDVRDELRKAARLVERGRCDVYLLMTNAGVTGRRTEELETEFLGVGVKRFRCFGGAWFDRVLTENKRLRMLVPRVYGLGDLTQILDERSYAQAQAVLESMRTELAKVVRTGTYDRAARALDQHGFVLLLGEPATGKTTVAAQLALAAVDVWGCSAIKIEDPASFRDRWNPEEPQQFFWIDDVFGSTQLDVGLAHSWTRAVPLLQAAIQRRARIVITSRDYIYRAARPHLKAGAFPLLDESQVVVDVHDLDQRERREILYNHLKHGSQPSHFLKAITGCLEALADHAGFTPELARRLANPTFTRQLGPSLSCNTLDEFFSHPRDFLSEVIAGLDDDGKAALGLIYLHRGFLPSPVALDSLQRDLLERLGGRLDGVLKSLAGFSGGLVLHTKQDSRPGWVFAHPSLVDAYAELLRSPDLLHLLAAGFPLDVLLKETTCGDVGIAHAIVLPPTMYPLVLRRLQVPLSSGHMEAWKDWARRLRYLAHRCDRSFLQLYIATHPDILDRVSDPGLMLDAVSEPELAVRLHHLGLLPEAHRQQFARVIMDYFIEGDDPGALCSEDLRGILTEDEVEDLRVRIVSDLEGSLDRVLSNWDSNYEARLGPPDQYFSPLVDLVEAARKEVPDNSGLAATSERILTEIERTIEYRASADDQYLEPRQHLGPSAPTASAGLTHLDPGGRSVFDDLLD